MSTATHPSDVRLPAPTLGVPLEPSRALAKIVAGYLALVLPRVCHEVAHWRALAARIPDPSCGRQRCIRSASAATSRAARFSQRSPPLRRAHGWRRSRRTSAGRPGRRLRRGLHPRGAVTHDPARELAATRRRLPDRSLVRPPRPAAARPRPGDVINFPVVYSVAGLAAVLSMLIVTAAATMIVAIPVLHGVRRAAGCGARGLDALPASNAPDVPALPCAEATVGFGAGQQQQPGIPPMP